MDERGSRQRGAEPSASAAAVIPSSPVHHQLSRLNSLASASVAAHFAPAQLEPSSALSASLLLFGQHAFSSPAAAHRGHERGLKISHARARSQTTRPAACLSRTFERTFIAASNVLHRFHFKTKQKNLIELLNFKLVVTKCTSSAETKSARLAPMRRVRACTETHDERGAGCTDPERAAGRESAKRPSG